MAEELYAPKSGLISIGREKWGLDIISAPSFSDNAIKLLGEREKRRLLVNENLSAPTLPRNELVIKPVRGGSLEQKYPNFILTPDKIESSVGAELSNEDFATLLIAWAVCWRASSNTVALAKDNMLIGLGCGQQDRIECVRLAIDRAIIAGHDTTGSFFASDAFFPYAESGVPGITTELINEIKAHIALAEKATSGEELYAAQIELSKAASLVTKNDKREGPELLVDAGCMGGVVPADGKNLGDVKSLFKETGLSIAFVDRENRGFSKH